MLNIHPWEKAAKRQVDSEMRSVEISVRGTKMKAFQKETPEEMASGDRNNFSTACGSSNYFDSSCRCQGKKKGVYNPYHQ